MIFASVVVLIAFALFLYVLGMDIPGTWKFAFSVAEMIVVGQILSTKYNLGASWGLILFRTKKGLDIIASLAKHEKFWSFFAEVGTIMSYGALSFIFMRKSVSRNSAIVGFILILFLAMFVSAPVLGFLAVNVKGALPNQDALSSGVSESATRSMDGFLILWFALLFGGGMFLVLLVSILMYGVVVLSALSSTIFSGTTAIQDTNPGATFLLPGINIPFIEGIIALLVILIVHEGAHAVLGKMARVPILSSGIVLFGVLPVGAFVEPDEEYLKKIEKTKQTRVLVAGSTANLITSVIAFVIFLGFMFSAFALNLNERGLLVASGDPSGSLQKGDVIYKFNGEDALGYKNLTIQKNSTVALTTNRGDISLKTNEDGKMGITFYPLSGGSLVFAKFKYGFLDFIYLTLGLIFALNFVVGTINLLPLPFFDGYRILELNAPHPLVAKAFMIITLVAFLMNFVPWLF